MMIDRQFHSIITQGAASVGSRDVVGSWRRKRALCFEGLDRSGSRQEEKKDDERCAGHLHLNVATEILMKEPVDVWDEDSPGSREADNLKLNRARLRYPVHRCDAC